MGEVREADAVMGTVSEEAVATKLLEVATEVKEASIVAEGVQLVITVESVVSKHTGVSS